jgi:2-keto-myo-inositol isomerase
MFLKFLPKIILFSTGKVIFGENQKRTAMLKRREAIKGMALLTGGLLSGAAGIPGKTAAKSSKAFSFCLNTSTISGQEIGFLEEFKTTAKAGYDGIEIWVRNLEKHVAEGGSLKELKKFTDDLGLTVENAIGFAQWAVDDEAVRKAGLEQMKREMDMLAQIGCKRIAAPPAGATNTPLPDLFEIGKRYRAVLELGDRTGVTPQLEIWGASATLYHISQAMFVASAANHPKACILPDVYHMFRGGSGFHSLKLLSGTAIEMFHFNDFTDAIPREKQNDSDRVYPGDGLAPFKQIITDLKNSGGKKVLSLELFNRSYWEKDAPEVAKTGLQKMKELVNSVN